MVTQVKRRVTIEGFVVKKTHPMRKNESTRVMTDFDRIEWISLLYMANGAFRYVSLDGARGPADPAGL